MRRVRSLYRWRGNLVRIGWISEAKLRAWEYRADADIFAEYASGTFLDTVRLWTTARPDLRVPEQLLVGDQEQLL